METLHLARSFKLAQRAFAALLTASLATVCVPGAQAFAQVRPTPTPIPTPRPSPRPLPRGIAPPSPIYPVTRVPAANPPFSFLWTPVSGATQYELQLSDRFDVRSHVLLDVTVFGTIYTFTNTNLPGSPFTALQPGGMALPAGTYHWRVRAISGTTATIFSPIAVFTLGTVPGARPLHDLAVARIAVAGDPTARIPSAILVTVENRGSFATAGAGLLVTIDGRIAASEPVKALGPGDSDTITIPWNPTQSGQTSIVATLDYADDIPAHKVGTFNVLVRAQTGVAGSFRGIVAGSCGAYLLKDAGGNTIATLVPANSAAVSSLYGQSAVVTGTYTIGVQGPQIEVTSAKPSGATMSGARMPCP